MKKLNNKGYLLVEIIVASVLAMTIGYFLINLTIKFSNQEEDIYLSISLTNDKNVVTNIIMDDVEKYTLLSASNGDNSLTLCFDSDKIEGADSNKCKDLLVDIGNKIISYGSDYSKQLDNSLSIGKPNINVGEDYTSISIPMTTLYSTEDYGINLFIPYSVG